MKKFHVILSRGRKPESLLDELGEEFSVELAYDTDDAWDTVAMDYPEFSVVSVLERKRYLRGY